jgi:hypothetical protein
MLRLRIRDGGIDYQTHRLEWLDQGGSRKVHGFGDALLPERRFWSASIVSIFRLITVRLTLSGFATTLLIKMN